MNSNLEPGNLVLVNNSVNWSFTNLVYKGIFVVSLDEHSGVEY